MKHCKRYPFFLIYFIDFQGAHLGFPIDDAASFIGDPYMYYDEGLQESLKQAYHKQLSAKLDYSWDHFEEVYHLCSAQRHMQALGAYGFLTKIRRKKGFDQYYSPALFMLKKDLENLPCPQLSFLVNKAIEVLCL